MCCSVFAGDLRYSCHSVEHVRCYHRFTVTWVNVIRTLNIIPEGDGLPIGNSDQLCDMTETQFFAQSPTPLLGHQFSVASHPSCLCVPKNAKFSPYLEDSNAGFAEARLLLSPKFLLDGLSSTSYQVHFPISAHNSSAVPNCAFQGISKVCAGQQNTM